jgi:hypothetical protein
MLTIFLAVKKFGTIKQARLNIAMRTPTMNKLMKESLLILLKKVEGRFLFESMIIHHP